MLAARDCPSPRCHQAENGPGFDVGNSLARDFQRREGVTLCHALHLQTAGSSQMTRSQWPLCHMGIALPPSAYGAEEQTAKWDSLSAIQYRQSSKIRSVNGRERGFGSV